MMCKSHCLEAHFHFEISLLASLNGRDIIGLITGTEHANRPLQVQDGPIWALYG